MGYQPLLGDRDVMSFIHHSIINSSRFFGQKALKNKIFKQSVANTI